MSKRNEQPNFNQLYVPTYRLLITNAVYECKGCEAKQTIPQEGEKLKAPLTCPQCGSKEFKLLPEESEFEPIGIAGWSRVR